MKKEKQKNIFFDLDGPLLDVSDRYYKVYSDFCFKTGLKPISKQKFWDRKRKEKTIIIPDSLKHTYRQYWLHHIEQYDNLLLDTPQKNVFAVLEKLKENYPLYLITLRNKRGNLLRQLEYLKLKKFFKKIFSQSPQSFDSKENWKIKAGVIQSFVQKEDVIVGDTATDINCGKNLKMKTLAITTGIKTRSILLVHKPDRIISNISMVPRILHTT